MLEIEKVTYQIINFLHIIDFTLVILNIINI